MKKFLFTILLLGLFVVFTGPGGELLSTLLRLGSPTSHEITPGDWLSKLALKHYGDVSYWKELALVNRAPNADLIFPDEELIIPSFDAIQKIRRTRSVAAINEILDGQIAILAGKAQAPEQPVASERNERPSSTPSPAESQVDAEETLPTTEPAFSNDKDEFASTEEITSDEAEGSFFTSTLGLTLIAVAVVVLVIGFIMYRRSKEREEAEEPNTDEMEEIRDDRPRGVFEFNHEADVDDSEPEKGKGKKNKKDEKLMLS